MFQIALGPYIIFPLKILLKTIAKLPFGTIILAHSIMYNVHSCMYHACSHESDVDYSHLVMTWYVMSLSWEI